ncbi:MAG: hypothetical protein RLZZ522_894, partial [Verrucomicrobiota bacterium]
HRKARPMSALPQHKKSPEELAKLRETLGIPPEAGGPAPPSLPLPLPLPEPEPEPGHPTHHSLKHVEPLVVPVPVLAAPGGGIEHLAVPAEPPAVVLEAKPVRSLKRSEREIRPHEARPAPAASKLPGHRHSEAEVAEIRRRSAIAAIAGGGFQLPQSARPPLLAAGYLLAIAGAAAPTLLKLLASLRESYTLGDAMSGGYHLLVACSLAALAVATYIYFKKTLSRHHAAFIAIIAVFALIFSILHYFPHLRYGA